MNETIISICKIHGETEFTQYSKRKRCKKCQVDAVKKRRKKIKILAIEYKGGKCIECGFDEIQYPNIFEFHHLDPSEKDFAFGEKGICRS